MAMVVKHSPLQQKRYTQPYPNTQMSTFDFNSVYTLDLTEEDNPSIDVRDGNLILTAKRGDDRIMITTPLNRVIAPVAPAVGATQVNKPRQSYRRRHPAKGRTLTRDHGAVGENSPMSKLNESTVKEILALYADESYRGGFQSRQGAINDLAKVYDVHWTTIWKIVNRRSWKHVD
jgi:hypothetical protein